MVLHHGAGRVCSFTILGLRLSNFRTSLVKRKNSRFDHRTCPCPPVLKPSSRSYNIASKSNFVKIPYSHLALSAILPTLYLVPASRCTLSWMISFLASGFARLEKSHRKWQNYLWIHRLANLSLNRHPSSTPCHTARVLIRSQTSSVFTTVAFDKFFSTALLLHRFHAGSTCDGWMNSFSRQPLFKASTHHAIKKQKRFV